MSARDPGLVGAGSVLLALGLPMLLLGLLLIPTGVLIATTEPEFARREDGMFLGLMIGIGESILIGGWGAVLCTVGAGLTLQKRWAWRMAVPILVLMTLMICPAPLALVGLFLLLRPQTRHGLGLT